MSNDRIPLLIDTDPGVDDALALLMAFDDMQSRSGRHEVVGLTIAAGNVGLRHTVANALKLCEVCGVDVPVFAGADAPLLHPSIDAAHVHGLDGFGDAGYVPAARSAEAEHAALAILRLSHAHAGRLLLVALGPLTNLALALRLDPTLPSRIARCVVMGGAVTAHGNITPAAEFNIAFDPEAAQIVFAAFPMIELVDWEATMAHSLQLPKLAGWLQGGSAKARFFDAISRRARERSEDRRGDDWYCADALAMAQVLQPDGALELQARPLVVETEGRHARGMTLVDWNRQTGAADNVAILLRYDQQCFEQQVARALA